MHAHHHLHGGLSTNAPVHVRLSGKVLGQIPPVGYGITHEYHPALDRRRCFEPQVILMVAAQLVPVLELVGKMGRRPRQATLRGWGIEVLHELRPHGKRQA